MKTNLSRWLGLAALFLTAGTSIAAQPSAPFTASFSGLVYDRATQTFNSVLTLTNTSASAVQSPLTVVIATGNAAVAVSGSSNGTTYIWNVSGGSVAASKSASTTIKFSDPTRVSFTPHVISVSGTSSSLPFSNATLYSNIGSPQILSFAHGETNFTFFGTRDSEGTPQSATSIQTTNGTSHAYSSVDSLGRPLFVHLNDGSDLTFVWESETRAILTAVSATGTQVSVAIDTPSAAMETTVHGAVLQVSGTRALGAIHPSTASDSVNGEIDVTVLNNSQPVSGASVLATVVPLASPNNPGYTLPIFESETVPGEYDAAFVNFEAVISPDTVKEQCNVIVDTVENICGYGVPISGYMATAGCTLISTALAAVTGGAGLAIAGPCEAFFAGFGSACAIPAAAPQGSTTSLCNNVSAIVDLYDPDGETITATATKDGVTGNVTNNFAGNTPTAALTINLPSSNTFIGVGSNLLLQGTTVDTGCENRTQSYSAYETNGPRTLRSDLSIISVSGTLAGPWVPSSVTEMGPNAFATAGTSTYTSSISAAGIVTTVEKGSFDENPQNPITGKIASTETINLVTGAYNLALTINQVDAFTNPTCTVYETDTDTETGTLPVSVNSK